MKVIFEALLTKSVKADEIAKLLATDSPAAMLIVPSGVGRYKATAGRIVQPEKKEVIDGKREAEILERVSGAGREESARESRGAKRRGGR